MIQQDPKNLTNDDLQMVIHVYKYVRRLNNKVHKLAFLYLHSTNKHLQKTNT